MDLNQLTILLFLKANKGTHTKTKVQQIFPTKRFGRTGMEVLMDKGYIEDEFCNNNYLQITNKGDEVIGVLDYMAQILP